MLFIKSKSALPDISVISGMDNRSMIPPVYAIILGNSGIINILRPGLGVIPEYV